MYIFEFFACSSKAGMVVLVVKPREVIKVHVSMYISMLDMVLSHYEHVLCPPSVFFNFRKVIVSAFLGHFLMV